MGGGFGVRVNSILENSRPDAIFLEPLLSKALEEGNPLFEALLKSTKHPFVVVASSFA